MRIPLSGDVANRLYQLAARLGTTTKVLLSLATEYAPKLLTEEISLVTEQQSAVTRVSLSDGAPGITFVTEVASTLGVPLGQVFDYLLNTFIPLAEYNPDIRKQVLRGRTIVQVNPFVLTAFCDYKDRNEDTRTMTNQQFVQYLVQDLPVELLVEMIYHAAGENKGTPLTAMTTMVLPRNIYTLISEAAGMYRLNKGMVISSFLPKLVAWHEHILSSTRDKDVAIGQVEAAGEADFRTLLEHAFELGFSHARTAE